MPRAARKPSYAALLVKLARAQATNNLDQYDQLRGQIDAVKAAEMEENPEHFRKSHEDKARLLLFGWFEGDQKELVRHRFPPPESYLLEKCKWSLVEVLRREGGPPTDILFQLASLFTPDDTHPFAEQMPFVARIGRRSRGAMKNVYAIEQIVAAVAAYERKGDGGGNLDRDAAVEEVAEWYGISREYVYECLRNASPIPTIPPRKRPPRRK
ncbi:hypothetical protein ACC797_22895 [Rhizobium ruizarguesonis]